MAAEPPLVGVKVLEIAGLAPGPFAGLLCADWGASVLRVDRATPNGTPVRTSDLLTRRKSSIQVNLKSDGGIRLIKDLVKFVDVLIDPFRPGVLEKLGLGPDLLARHNPRLIVARMTGFRRDGKYRNMAGHDINYIAVSGVLSMLGPKDGKPAAAINLLGDFAGGGLVCFLGIVLALFERTKTGKGQFVEANMVDGSAFIATSPRLAMKTPLWSGQRGTNLLDGGCPYYDTYETLDGKYIAVGALEPQFFAQLLKGLSLKQSDFPGPRDDRETWPFMRKRFTQVFKSKTRQQWEAVFDGTDACVVPVLSQGELETQGYQQRPIVTLQRSPSLAISTASPNGPGAERGQGEGVQGDGWTSPKLIPGHDGKKTLLEWVGWQENTHFSYEDGGLARKSSSKL